MKEAEVDTSGFQSIVLMLIGVLMIMLISNVLTIISNPENITIDALVTGIVYQADEEDRGQFVPPKFQNITQKPIYIDVEPDRLIIYPERIVVPARDLLIQGNEFEKLLNEVEQVKEANYFVLLLRPGSATFQRRLRKVIHDRGIDVGFEPWEADRKILLQGETADDATVENVTDNDAPHSEQTGDAADEPVTQTGES